MLNDVTNSHKTGVRTSRWPKVLDKESMYSSLTVSSIHKNIKLAEKITCRLQRLHVLDNHVGKNI